MKIESIRIQKFRSIDDAKIDFMQFLAIVGANNVGKSHILRALNAFFNFSEEKEYFLNESHRYSAHSRPKIVVVFNEIEEKDKIPKEYIYGQKLTIKFIYRWDRKNPSYEIIRGVESQALDSDKFYELVKHFTYIYIPIIRSYNEAFSTNSGIAYKLLKQIFDQQTLNRNNLRPAAERFIKKVENSLYSPAIKQFKKYYPFVDGHDFNMQTYNADIIDLILHNSTLKLIENSQENTIDNCGSGIQSAVYFAISLAISMTEGNNFLIGIDEPELNMHPQAQRQLIEALRDEKRYPHSQFVVTTHSTVIIDKIGHDLIVLCKKIKGKSRDVITDISQIDSSFWSKYQLEEERYYTFFDFKNSDFFFSNYIIITESSNDCKVVQHLLELCHIDTEKLGISLIPANGEKNIKYPYAVAKELKIPFICVVDRDVFQPYLKDKRDDSLNNLGIPEYKKELKTSSSILQLIDSQDVEKLKSFLIEDNYNDALDLLANYNIVSMRFAFEVDLVLCASYCNSFCNQFQIKKENQKYSYLLKNKGKEIKKYIGINKALDEKGIKNLPKSYRQIINLVKQMIS